MTHISHFFWEEPGKRWTVKREVVTLGPSRSGPGTAPMLLLAERKCRRQTLSALVRPAPPGSRPTTRPPRRHVGERGRLPWSTAGRSDTLFRSPWNSSSTNELMRWPHPADDEVAGLHVKGVPKERLFVSPRPSTNKDALPSGTVLVDDCSAWTTWNSLIRGRGLGV